MSLTVTPLPTATATYVQVNIGRNVGDKPMRAGEWARFRGEVESTLFNAIIGRGIVSEHRGMGAWLSENGQTTQSEESAYLSTFAVVDLDALRTALRRLRVKHGQDAIALIVGSELH